jgi:protein ImuA
MTGYFVDEVLLDSFTNENKIRTYEFRKDPTVNQGGQGEAAAQITALRRRIAAIEQGPPRVWQGAAPLTLGVRGIDGELPSGGLARGALHEVLGGVDQPSNRGGAALAFTAVLAARRAALSSGQVLWCLSEQGLYGPGLAAFGLGAERLILARGRDDQQRLWAMEEGLKCTDLAMVVGEVGRLDLGQSRRLQLAAETSGVTALLLHRRGGNSLGGLGISAALTRWRITPAPSAETQGYTGIGAARCRVELLRCKGGRPGSWLLQWNGEGWDEQDEQTRDQPQTHPLPVAAAMAHGPAVPRLAESVRAHA